MITSQQVVQYTPDYVPQILYTGSGLDSARNTVKYQRTLSNFDFRIFQEVGHLFEMNVLERKRCMTVSK